MQTITIELAKDKLADLIDLILESDDVPNELYEASVRWEIEAFGIEAPEVAAA